MTERELLELAMNTYRQYEHQNQTIYYCTECGGCSWDAPLEVIESMNGDMSKLKCTTCGTGRFGRWSEGPPNQVEENHG